MPKRKTGGTMLPWLSARLDGREGRFIQVGNSLLLSRKFQDLSSGARFMYLSMTLEAGGKREFVFPRSASLKYGISESSAIRHIKELVAAGFIEVTACGRYARVPNCYRFSFKWKGVTEAR